MSANHEAERTRLLGVAWADVEELRVENRRLLAAIERVRELIHSPSAWAYTDGPSAEDVERALDGATS